jgi:hypothetical protein
LKGPGFDPQHHQKKEKSQAPVAHAYNLATQEAEIRKIAKQNQPE